MKTLLVIVFALFSVTISAQEKYNNCAAAFLNNKMIVEKYEPHAKAHITKNATGELTVCTADISELETKAVDKIMFSIAIKNSKTGTILLVTKKSILRFDIATVLTKCNIGDSIILLTENDAYALPHNEILVE